MFTETPSSDLYRLLGEFITTRAHENWAPNVLDAMYARLQDAEARLASMNTEGLDAAKTIVGQRDAALARVEELEKNLTQWKKAFAEQAAVVVEENDRLKNLPTLGKPSTPSEALEILGTWFAAYYAKDPEDYIAPDCRRLAAVSAENEKKLADVLAVPHMAPDNSWAAGDSAAEAGWAYAIRYVRSVLGSPIAGCDNGMRPS